MQGLTGSEGFLLVLEFRAVRLEVKVKGWKFQGQRFSIRLL